MAARFMKNTKTGGIFPYNEAHIQNLFQEGLKNRKLRTNREQVNPFAECDAKGLILVKDRSVEEVPGDEQPGDEQPGDPTTLVSKATQLAEMTREELVNYGAALKVDLDMRMNKQTMIAHITAAEARV